MGHQYHGNWSGGDVIAFDKQNFMISMRTEGANRGLMGLADVYAHDFGKNLDEAMKVFSQGIKIIPI